MHILIVGPRQVGKSTLIDKVLKAAGRPVWGFETKKEAAPFDEELGCPIHIYDAGSPHIQTKDNLVGYCLNHRPTAYPEGFDHFAKKMQTPPEQGSIIKMDELGFIESDAKEFCNTILHYLDGDIPVIAAVKNKSTPFLDAVKNHPNCKCFYISEENRDALADEVLEFLIQQL